jgi:hypothetical protein
MRINVCTCVRACVQCELVVYVLRVCGDNTGKKGPSFFLLSSTFTVCLFFGSFPTQSETVAYVAHSLVGTAFFPVT